MTHPLRDPKANGANRKVKQGEPFDPEDLSRRLQAHLVEQKLKAERRRDARATKSAAAAQENVDHHVPKVAAAAQENVYHHVPKVAAAAFERTTTPDAMRQVHKLAQPAIKAHLELLTIDDAVPGQAVTSLKRTQAMDQAVVERDLLRTRNQFQWDHTMEEAAEVDVYRDVYKPPQRTFINEFSHLRIRQEKKNPRPLSTGDILSEEDEAHATTKAKRKSKPSGYDMTERNNWAQRDEGAENKSSKKEKEALIVRKKPSSWILLGKRSPKLDKGDAVAVIRNTGSPPDGNKSAKASFLARFKRHPS
jgi:hypothetical protein